MALISLSWNELGAAAACLSAISAVLAVMYTAAVGGRSTRAHVIVHCNTRYDELAVYRTAIPDDADSEDSKVKSYFRRYWGLKSDQIDYWLSGYIDPETLASWLMSTVDALRSSDLKQTHVASHSYLISWTEVRAWHDAVNPTFYHIMEELIGISPDIDKKRQYASVFVILDGVEKSERKLIGYLNSIIPRRMRMKHLGKTLSPEMQTLVSNLNSNSRR